MKVAFKYIITYLLKAKARAFLAQNKVEVIAITGSVGKTSTKEAIYAVLKSKFDVASSKKSFNTDIGMCLAILGQHQSGFSSVTAWFKILKQVFLEEIKAPSKMVLEMGADKPGDLERLMRIAPPVISVVTNVNEVHLGPGQFPNIEAIAKEKSTLVRLLPQSATAVLNADDERVINMPTRANKLTFGLSETADLKAKAIHSTSVGLSFSVEYKGKTEAFSLPIIGEFQVYVMLPAIAVGLSMGMSLKECITALADYQLPPGRMSPIEGLNDSHILDGSYNASPKTVETSLAMVHDFRAPRKIIALGTMNELGELSYEAHLKAGEQAARVGQLLIFVGKEASALKKGAMNAGFKESAIYTFFNSIDAGVFLADKLREDDLILVKGSQNAVRMERFVEKIMKEPMKAGELLCRQGEGWGIISR